MGSASCFCGEMDFVCKIRGFRGSAELKSWGLFTEMVNSLCQVEADKAKMKVNGITRELMRMKRKSQGSGKAG